MKDTEWMLEAACSPSWVWTGVDVASHTLEWMRATCSGCSVRRECASYALEHRLEGGMYAGVQVPVRDSHSTKHDWDIAVNKARRELERVMTA